MIVTRRLAILELIVVTALFPRSGGAQGEGQAALRLFEDGRPKASILTESNPGPVVQLAVAELNHHLEKTCGAKLPVVKEGDAVKGAVVYIGWCREAQRRFGVSPADLARQEYVVSTRPGALWLVGHDERLEGVLDYEKHGVWRDYDIFQAVGTVYAVYDFLERVAGVRWYMPGEIGTVIQPTQTLDVPPLDVRRAPWAKYREVVKKGPIPEDPVLWRTPHPVVQRVPERLDQREVDLYWLRQRMGGDFHICNHSFHTYRFRFGKSHPEYFGVHNGKPDLEQMDFASEELKNQVVEDILAMESGNLRDEANDRARLTNSRRGLYSVVPMDIARFNSDADKGGLIKPAPERVIAARNTDMASSYVFTFVRDVARRVAAKAPNAEISTLAYSHYFFAPPDLEFPDNVSVTVCLLPFIKDRTDEYDADYYGALRQWKAKVDDVYVWTYFLAPQFRKMNNVPGIVPRRIGTAFRALHDIGIRGMFLEFHMASGFPPIEDWYFNPIMEHLNIYFAMKTLDSVERSTDERLDEYFRLFYGPAATPIRKFVEKIEFAYLDRRRYDPSEAHWRLTARSSWTKYCPPEDLAVYRDWIDEARRAAGDQSPYAERVDLFDRGVLQFMERHSKEFFSDDGGKHLTCSIIDGELEWDDIWDETAWERTGWTKAFSKTDGEEVPGTWKTRAQALRDDGHLYFLLRCDKRPQFPLEASKAERDHFGLATDHHVSVILDDGAPGGALRHFAVNAEASLLDETFEPGQEPSDATLGWNSGFEAKVQISPRPQRYWNVIVRIPLSAFESAPEAGDEWRLKLFRFETLPQNWPSTARGDRRSPEHFAALKFGKSAAAP